MSKQLSTADVSLSTVSVNIQVIRVGNRQMTLAVFRQLIDELIPFGDFHDPYMDELDDNITVWGWVEYHTSACYSVEHLHVVYQLDDKLYRCSLDWYKHRNLFNSIRERTPQLFIAV